MAIDASIYGQIQQPQQVNPLASLAQAYQIRGAQAQLDKVDRDEQRQNRLLGVLQSPEFQSGDASTRARLAYGAGDVEAASKITTAAAAASKDQREAEKFQLEGGLKRLEMIGQVAGTVKDQQSYVQALGILQNNGIDTSKFNPNYDPAGVAQFAQAAMSRKDQMEQEWKAKGFDLDTQRVAETARHNRSTEGLTAAGQQAVDARAREANAIAANNKGGEAVTTLRKEFNALPEVKNYTEALPAYKAITDAATRNTPQSDINLVYGVAKLYDPTSVVREGEYATVASAQSIPEHVKKWAQYIQGGGKLTPETKKQILQEAQGRMATFQEAVEQRRTQYKDIASRTGVDPTLVLDQGYKPPVPPKGNKPAGGGQRTVTRTGTLPNGRKVVQYSDGSTEYAD
jgi:hypothetical protein